MFVSFMQFCETFVALSRSYSETSLVEKDQWETAGKGRGVRYAEKGAKPPQQEGWEVVGGNRPGRHDTKVRLLQRLPHHCILGEKRQ